MSLEAIFFDLGGTLLDLDTDRRAHLEMMRRLRRRWHLTSDAESLLERFEAQNEAVIAGLGSSWLGGQEVRRRVLTGLLEEVGLSLTEARWRDYQDAHDEEHLRWMRLFPEAEGVLHDLRAAPVHVGLLSDVDEDFLQLCLFRFPLEDLLSSITTSEEVGAAKPQEAIFRRALSKAGCPPDRAVHVGDSLQRDVEGARRAGLISVLISPGGEEGADHVVPSLEGAHRVLRRLLTDGGA